MLSSLFSARAQASLAPLAGISWCSLELNLLAALSRVPFQLVTHFFDYWLTAIEIGLSILTLGTLVVVLNCGLRPISGPRPKETFNMSAALVVCLCMACVLANFNRVGFLPYFSLSFSVFIETAAVVAQTQLFQTVKRMPGTASNALALLALSRALRLVMWTTMCFAGEFEWALMASDVVHFGMLWRFIRAYIRSRAAGTSELLLATLRNV